MPNESPRENSNNGSSDDSRPGGTRRNDGVIIIEQRKPSRRDGAGRAVVRQRASLPAPVKKAAVAVAAGAVLQVGIGIAGKLLAARAAKSAAEGLGTKALQAKSTGKRGRKPEIVEEDPVAPFDDVDAVVETLIVRRTWYRRPR